ncbi:TOMM precursor leader peptide-binding protein [Streptomyces litchfieldiae]|uniref:TOMM leader peptide-binding protein n=1 Tax=Streptomyces litchfieldiae TaxID=3075543 RepID=A0ABU2MUL0_9ACTN|nr:TOMM precursor leader peptide-binding protein [Streptomyces sp. DSM 44938]MDT0344998.1 TOMM precursor leader peptide-binding protein [Streptomyces sp. DSM 44938]
MPGPPRERPRLCVLGSGGALHDAILARGGAPAGSRALLVAVHEGWDTALHATARRTAADHGMAWLPVRTELSHAVIGPLEEPGAAGCADCAADRARRIRPDQAERDLVRQRHGAALAARPSSWLTGGAAELVGGLVAEEAQRLSDPAAGEPRTRRALLRVALDELSVSRHPFLPDPLCPVCGGVPEDTAERAVPELRARPAYRPGTYRTRAIGEELPALTETYVDEQVGLIGTLEGRSSGGLVVTSAPVGFRSGRRDAGHGRAATYRASRLTALLEAVERYGGSPGGRGTAVVASLAELGDRAVDPATVGVHTPEQYALRGFPFEPFSPEAPLRWVWGWSFARGEPLLVPETLAYREAGRGFVYETSNGCALGGSLEEAILYGLLEVAERDAFLLTWYARLPAPEIELSTAADRTVPLLAATVRAETGYRVRAFDISTEQGIPCVWAMAVNPADDGRPALVCAGGSHADPETAISGALHELSPALTTLLGRYADEDETARARRMAADPALVRGMDDHALLYANPGAAARLDFLTAAQPSRKTADIGQEPGGFAADDLRENLREAVRRFTRHGMDVIVVDQTAAEHRAGGLRCVKVLVPGALPLTFGHAHRRVTGLPRLPAAPVRLGHRDRPLAPEEVNPHPHPLP